MKITRPRAILLCTAIFVLMTLEPVLFGRDTPGTAHDMSVSSVDCARRRTVLVMLIAAAAISRVRSRDHVDA